MTTIELAKEDQKFSIAHFTIFSKSNRERLHGHNFTVSAQISAPVSDEGMCFNYQVYKKKLKDLCQSLNQYTILPQNSPHLKIEEEGNQLIVKFNHEKIPFLQADTLILPITNTTVEEFSHFFIKQLTSDKKSLKEHMIKSLVVKVSSGPGQSGTSQWSSESVGE